MALEDIAQGPRRWDRVDAARRDKTRELLGDTLTVGELQHMLARLDPTLPVMMSCGEGGLSGALRLERVPVQVNVNTLDGFGPHDIADDSSTADATAVVLSATPITAD